MLTDVSILSTPVDALDPEAAPPLEEDFLIPISALKTNEPGTVYVAFKNISEASYPSCTFSNILKFTSKEIDPSTNEPEETGYDDEYQIEDLELGGPDWVVPAFAGSWEGVWDSSSGGDEASETLVLSGTKSIAGKSLLEKLTVHIDTNYQKMPLHNSQTSFNCSRWMVAMSPCPTQRIHSSSTARASTAAR